MTEQESGQEPGQETGQEPRQENGQERADDDALLAELAETLTGTKGLIEAVAARAKDSFTWRTIEEDLLFVELSFDSDLHAAATLRAEPQRNRVLEFTAALEVEVFDDRVEGQVEPVGSGAVTVTVELERGGTIEAQVTPLGFFVVRPVPRGVVRFRCSTSSGELVTDWVLL